MMRFFEKLEELGPSPWMRLQGLALLLRLPRYAHHLEGRHSSGRRYRFDAGFQFATDDAKTVLHARFADGRMHVGTGELEGADVRVRFRDVDAMNRFFAGADVFDMLLANVVEIDGNLSHVAKLGHITTDLRLRGKKRRARPREPTGAWPELVGPGLGEPCPQPIEGEVRWLEDPHFADLRLDDLPRIKRLLWAHRHAEPEVCTERARLVTEHALRETREPRREDRATLRQARMLRYLLGKKLAVIHDDDLLAGTTTSRRVGVILYPELGGTALWPELLTVESRSLNPYRISDEDIRVLDREVFPFWMRENVREHTRLEHGNPESLRLDERFVLYFLWKNYAVSHTVADFPAVLERGLEAIASEAREHARTTEDARARDSYRAMQLTIEGVLDYAGRLAAHARHMAEQLRDRGAGAASRAAELLEMARVCDKVPAGPAETLHEALQSIWIVFLALHQESMNAGLSLGRLDTWLSPYLERELASARDTDERRRRAHRAIELTCAFMLKLTDHLPLVPDIGNRLFGGSSSDQAITLGGVAADGSSAVCDMTWVFLAATALLGLRDPNMNARFAPGVNSRDYLRRACEVNLITHATPSIHNDAAMLPALEKQGFTAAEARDWAATGCVEPTVCGRHFGHTGSIMLNLVAPLEMALRDGVHPLLGRRVGPATGDPRGMVDFADFIAAFETQLTWLIRRAVEANNLLGVTHQQLHPTPLLSAVFRGPMESGRDVIDGGAEHNTTGVANVGLTDVVDSLCAIRTMVFDERRCDFATLLRALDADFDGYGTLLAEIQSRAPKLGQDHPLPLEIARELLELLFERFQAETNYRGGRYLPGFWSMSNHVAFGMLSGALPSGRLRGKAFAPGLTPSPLCTAPLTEQLRAIASLDTTLMPNNLAFNVKVAPGANDSRTEVIDRMTAYVATYFDLGGMQIQLNATSTQTLREAMERPDDYRNLLVRISGYNAYFVELNREMQLELIERTEHHLGS